MHVVQFLMHFYVFSWFEPTYTLVLVDCLVNQVMSLDCVIFLPISLKRLPNSLYWYDLGHQVVSWFPITSYEEKE
ncbi:hypothetical protein L2E82_10989 [Cichorium intybus]|uniref:Uncharacterized protein n=1 Tax=Cichorium intybus TaxID=13427 RepID=A0ACB9GD54_CICIN|nr:hypothetical protein L2E82_10989 [Cichorium intybus]